MDIEKIYIEKDALNYPMTKEICRKFDSSKSEVSDINDVYHMVANANDPISYGKKILLLSLNKGAFIKKCPGTKYYNCCGYQILHIGTYCTMDCSYCILQAYFHPPILQLFVNDSDMFVELDNRFLSAPKTMRRLGTGEFTDSLIWENIYGFSEKLIEKFSKQNNSVLELKTKTVHIDTLKNLNHRKKTIVAWSVNTPYVISTQERRTTTLEARFKAASLCESWGYPIAFHFDPLVIYDGCENDYKKVIEGIFSSVSSQNIVWISIGSFRYIPALKPIIQDRFPKSKIVYGEFITGDDGKMRYFKPIRMKLYQTLIRYIKEIAPDVLVYFCMENNEVWEKCLGFIPKPQSGVSEMLDESVIKKCELS